MSDSKSVIRVLETMLGAVRGGAWIEHAKVTTEFRVLDDPNSIMPKHNTELVLSVSTNERIEGLG